MKKPEAIQILLDSNRGVYIPQTFVDDFDLSKFEGISESDIAICKRGPDEEWYWDRWTHIVDNARHVDENGNVFLLHHDGDLFLYCSELMTDEERENFFES